VPAFAPIRFQMGRATCSTDRDIGRRLDRRTLSASAAPTARSSCMAFASSWPKLKLSCAGIPTSGKAVVLVTKPRRRTHNSPLRVGRTVCGDAAAIRASWRRTFPGTWCLRTWSCLPKMPLSPAGKIDRQALERLPMPQERRPHPAGSPATQAQALFAGIWREGIRSASHRIDDNFFDLGGVP